MENFSFCSIPLHKTNKNICFKTSKPIVQNKQIIKKTFENVKSKGNITVLYDTLNKNISKISANYDKNYDLPSDLKDVKLYPLNSEEDFRLYDFSNNDLVWNSGDCNIIDYSLNLIDELGYEPTFKNNKLNVLDMDLNTMMDMYYTDLEENNNFDSM